MFRQSLRSTPPHLNPNFWSFAITGALTRPLILSYADLQTYPTETQRIAITCGGSTAACPMIGEAVWRGVRLSALLGEIDIAPDAVFAKLHAADGYTALLPVEKLGSALLAYEMDGAPLLPEHGFPARLVVPGAPGYKMPKWIERIELTTSAAGGFWESRGWPVDGAAPLGVAILGHEAAPDALTLHGVAHGGSHNPDALQVSIDAGGWMPIEFTPAEPFALTRWHIDWNPPGAGDYQVRVRATQGAATAEHTMIIQVR